MKPETDAIRLLVGRAHELHLLEMSTEEKLARFGDELDAHTKRNQLEGEDWFEPERGAKTNAIRFFRKQELVLLGVICDVDNGCLKPEFRRVLDSGGTVGIVTALANAIVASIDPRYAVPSLVVTFAIWLSTIGLDTWCQSRGLGMESGSDYSS